MQTMHLPLLLCLMTVPPCSTSNSFLMTGSVIREFLCHRLWHMNIFHYSWAVPQGILRRYWGKRLWGSHSGADWTSLQVGDPPIGLEPSLVFVASYSSGCGWKCALHCSVSFSRWMLWILTAVPSPLASPNQWLIPAAGEQTKCLLWVTLRPARADMFLLDWPSEHSLLCP